jgi:polyferredoxin
MKGGEFMHGNDRNLEIERSKTLSILFLTVLSIAIITMGLVFSVYSVLYSISFTVLNNSVHGVVFGLMVIYLGLKYFFSVKKLKIEVYKPTSRFSFNNFKK